MTSLTDDQIRHMVTRFLRWRLPDTFNPDCGISFVRSPGWDEGTPFVFEPVGTNLFDADQAEEMVRHIVEDLPATDRTGLGNGLDRVGAAFDALSDLQQEILASLMERIADHVAAERLSFAARERELLDANNRYLDEARIARATAAGGFQSRVDPWLIECFGETIARDRQERNHRFLEETLELTQAAGCTASEAHQLVDYVFSRPVGEMPQEIGGVMVTLAALCLAHGQDMAEAGERELARIWTKVEAIRAKQAAKPKHSPLPQHVNPAQG